MKEYLVHISSFDIVLESSTILLRLYIIKIGVIMKLYKFRSLGGEIDFCRVKDIIETGEFWCSYFWELNDPMEGLFFANPDLGKEIYEIKKRYLICSFSGIYGFKNPLLWGYYANGFKGVAIEIEVNSKDIYQIQYVSEILPIRNSKNNIDDKYIQEILKRKLKKWQHEKEFRFLRKTNENKQKIGEIINVYFGDPYGNIDDSSELKKENVIEEYNINKKKLEEFIDNIKNSRKHIGYKDVEIYYKNNRTYVGVKNEEW
jgi:hypothetical protein